MLQKIKQFWNFLFSLRIKFNAAYSSFIMIHSSSLVLIEGGLCVFSFYQSWFIVCRYQLFKLSLLFSYGLIFTCHSRLIRNFRRRCCCGDTTTTIVECKWNLILINWLLVSYTQSPVEITIEAPFMQWNFPIFSILFHFIVWIIKHENSFGKHNFGSSTTIFFFPPFSLMKHLLVCQPCWCFCIALF